MAITETAVAPTLNVSQLTQMVRDFYWKADNSYPLAEMMGYIADDIYMAWAPTCTFNGLAGFEEFYRCLTQNLFDRNHAVSDIDVHIQGDEAEIHFVIELTARRWFPPMPKSVKIHNRANFTWKIRLSPTTKRPVVYSNLLTKVYFFEDSVIVVADEAFKYVRPLSGPFTFTPE